jgi:hypothetical protein
VSFGGYNIERLVSEDLKRFGDETGLIENLAAVANSGFGRNIEYNDVRDHLLGGDILYLFRKNDAPVGFVSFLSYTINETSMLFLDGIVISKDHQKQGIATHVISSELEQKDYSVIALRTQSPVMYSTLKSLPSVKRVYPNLDELPSGTYQTIKELYSRRYNREIPRDLVVRGARKGVYSQVPIHPRYTKFFNETLGVDAVNGDFVFVFGEIQASKLILTKNC